jgi:hypothetical protein
VAKAAELFGRSANPAVVPHPADYTSCRIGGGSRVISLRRWNSMPPARESDERIEHAICPSEKVHHGFERMRLRGLPAARDEFHHRAIVQNLKTLALHALGPPPIPTARTFA